MAKRLPSNYFIDTGGVDLFVMPPDKSIVRFWQALEKQNVQHAICYVVYWEFLRKYGRRSNDQARQNFRAALKREILSPLPFDQQTADIAVKLFQGVKSRLDGTKTEKRVRMDELQCDIMIAAVAVRNRKIVVTDDLDDWGLLQTVVQYEGLGTLPLLGKDDMRNPKKWKGK
ncbi:hypothetical protein LCGC14_0983110 [marine sediment metagenome]|uniref:PIN domain-containing protein n=1 Tax=marine sediment metagenome TaxID=412755 RepID=A0A0F9QRC8_9ZZZZ